MIKFWTSPQDLGGVVSRSIVKLIKSHPRDGWIKATSTPIESNLEKIQKQQYLEKIVENQKREIHELKCTQTYLIAKHNKEIEILNKKIKELNNKNENLQNNIRNALEVVEKNL